MLLNLSHRAFNSLVSLTDIRQFLNHFLKILYNKVLRECFRVQIASAFNFQHRFAWSLLHTCCVHGYSVTNFLCSRISSHLATITAFQAGKWKETLFILYTVLKTCPAPQTMPKCESQTDKNPNGTARVSYLFQS